MSALAMCVKCHNYYTEPDTFYKKMDQVFEKESVYQAIITCQCGHKHVVGGDYFGEAINMFGYELKDDESPEFDQYDAVMLTECHQSDPDRVASTYYSVGYFGNGRTVHLKPGVPKYIFRNFPCNCENQSHFGVRFCVSGSFQDKADKESSMSGVLEWCVSFVDALNIKKLMQQYATPDSVIEVEIFGIDKKDKWSDRIYCNPQRRVEAVAKQGDIIAYVTDDKFFINKIADVYEDPYGKKRFVLSGHLYNKCRRGCPIFDTTYDKLKFVILEKFKGAPAPMNKYRSRLLAKHTVTKDGEILPLSHLPYCIPSRYLKKSLIDQFREQYPQPADGSFNKKLFKRWLYKNWTKIFLSKKDCLAIYDLPN